MAAYLRITNPAPSKGRSEQLFVMCGSVGFLILYRLLNWFSQATSFPPARVVIVSGPSWDAIRRARCVSPCCNAFRSALARPPLSLSTAGALCRSHPRDSRANALDHKNLARKQHRRAPSRLMSMLALESEVCCPGPPTHPGRSLFTDIHWRPGL